MLAKYTKVNDTVFMQHGMSPASKQAVESLTFRYPLTIQPLATVQVE